MSVHVKTGSLLICAAVVGACSLAVPTGDTGVSAVGDHIRLYEGPELEAGIGTGYAAGHLGEEFLVLGAALVGANGGGVAKVDRAEIFVQTPDLRKIPLMTQQEYREVYGKLTAAVRLAEISTPNLLESGGMRRPCFEWFFKAPTDGFARDVLMVRPFNVCEGVFLFHVPGGVQTGRWELEIKLEESVVEIPFHLESD